MNVNLTQEMADFVSSELASGDYASASELVREALGRCGAIAKLRIRRSRF